MIPHILIILFVASLWFLNEYGVKIPQGKAVLFLVLWLYSGFRYGVGIDYFMYAGTQDYTGEIHSSHMESVWLIIREIIHFFHLTSQAWFLLTSFAITYFFFKGIEKLSINFYFSLLLFVVCYFYFESMNGVRQYVAVGILFSSFHYVIGKQMWKYLIAVIIASLFHTSALFMLPFIFLMRIKIPDWLLLALIIVSFFTGTMLMNLFLEKILPLMSASRYAQYKLEDVPVVLSTGLQKIFFNLLMIGIIFISQRVRKLYEYSYIYINMVVCGIVLYNTFMLFQPALRLYWYLFPFIIILIPLLLQVFTLRTQKILQFAIILAFSAFTIKELTTEERYHYDFNINLIRHENSLSNTVFSK